MRRKRRRLFYVTQSGVYVSRYGWPYLQALLVFLLLLSILICSVFLTATLHHDTGRVDSASGWWQSEPNLQQELP